MALLAAALVALALTAVALAAPAGTADLRIFKTDSPDPARVGTTLTYSIRVENQGPAGATGVTVTDNLPKDVDLVSAVSTAGSCARQGERKVSCELGALGGTGPDYSPPIVTIAVIPRQAGTIVNTASVDGDQKDPVRGNDKATATTRVLGPATCRGRAATITGSAGADVLAGTGGPDVIVSLAGADTVRSGAGRDLICAGAGRDLVVAGSAADRIFAGAGRDRLYGRGGPDALRGGAGIDLCRGGPGRDSLRSCER